MLDSGHTGNGIFDLFRNLCLKFRRGRSRLCDLHGNNRNINIGKAGYRQRAERKYSDNNQHCKQYKRHDWLTDRPGRNIECHYNAPLLVFMAVTASPSRKKAPALAIIVSPLFRPSLISTIPCVIRPGMTLRSTT